MKRSRLLSSTSFVVPWERPERLPPKPKRKQDAGWRFTGKGQVYTTIGGKDWSGPFPVTPGAKLSISDDGKAFIWRVNEQKIEERKHDAASR